MRKDTAHTSQDFETELRELRAHLADTSVAFNLVADALTAMTDDVRTMVRMSRGPCAVAAGLSVIRVTKSLERIADHATNVAEELIFMVRADDVRHGRWLRPPGPDGAGSVAVGG